MKLSSVSSLLADSGMQFTYVDAGILDKVRNFIDPDEVKVGQVRDALSQLSDSGCTLVPLQQKAILEKIISKLNEKHIPYKTLVRNNKVAILLQGHRSEFKSVFDSDSSFR